MATGSAAIWLYPLITSCTPESKIQVGATQYTQPEMDNIFEFSKSILPAMDDEKFLWLRKYMADCFSPDNQNKFRDGYDHFIKTYLKDSPNTFSELPLAQKLKILELLEEGKHDIPSLTFFYTSLKSLSIRAFTGSKYYLTQIKPYVLIPGKYQGCV